MRSCLGWSSLVLLSAMAAPSMAADLVSVTNQEDLQCPGREIVVTAYFTNPQDCHAAELFVTAKLKPGYWLYSITQPSGGPHRTIIELEESTAFRLLGSFTAIQQPVREKTEWPEWPVLEKHPGCVTWHAVIEFAAGVDLAKLTIKGVVKGQVDTATFCLAPTPYPFTAALKPPCECAARRLPSHRFMCRLHAIRNRHFVIGRDGW